MRCSFVCLSSALHVQRQIVYSFIRSKPPYSLKLDILIFQSHSNSIIGTFVLKQPSFIDLSCLCLAPLSYSFRVFKNSFCDELLQELDNFFDSGLPRSRPNSMNNFGVSIVFYYFLVLSQIFQLYVYIATYV